MAPGPFITNVCRPLSEVRLLLQLPIIAHPIHIRLPRDPVRIATVKQLECGLCMFQGPRLRQLATDSQEFGSARLFHNGWPVNHFSSV